MSFLINFNQLNRSDQGFIVLILIHVVVFVLAALGFWQRDLNADAHGLLTPVIGLLSYIGLYLLFQACQVRCRSRLARCFMAMCVAVLLGFGLAQWPVYQALDITHFEIVDCLLLATLLYSVVYGFGSFWRSSQWNVVSSNRNV